MPENDVQHRAPSPGRRLFLKLVSLAAVGAPGQAVAAPAPVTPDPKALDMQLRAIQALLATHDAGVRNPALASLETLSRDMPEARDLLTLRQLFAAKGTVMRPPTRIDDEALHTACQMSRAVRFSYVSALGQASHRTVLPIDVVHPMSGSLLLAWCEHRSAFRKFYTHRMDDLTVLDRGFATQRPALAAQFLSLELSERYDD